jgi:syntaxin 18
VEDSFSTVDNVGSGNKELKRATERRSTAQAVFWSTTIFCTTLVLWDLFI